MEATEEGLVKCGGSWGREGAVWLGWWLLMVGVIGENVGLRKMSRDGGWGLRDNLVVVRCSIIKW